MATNEKPVPERRGPKSTRKEVDERTEIIANMLALDVPTGRIKKFAKDKWGVRYRQTARYMARARDILVKWSQLTPEEHFIQAASFWRGVIQNPSTDIKDKMQARENLDRLFGIKPPEVHVLAGDPNAPIVVTVESILAARKRVSEWRQDRFGEIAHDGNGAGNGETGAAGAVPGAG